MNDKGDIWLNKQEVGKERPVPAGLKAETWAFLLGEK